MAFSFRKIISNIGYFKKPGDENNTNGCAEDDLDIEKIRCASQLSCGDVEIVNFESLEPDSTSIQLASSLNIHETEKKITSKKESLSDTDLATESVERGKKTGKRRMKKLKLNIKKANQSYDEDLNRSIENTPKHVLLECKSSEVFSEKLKQFDFSKSFEIDSDSSNDEENYDIESLSEDDISLESNEEKSTIKMCRRVSGSQSCNGETQLVPSASLESFGDVEIDRNEDDRITLLVNYQIKFEKMECFLKKLLTEFQFHIEVSKIFSTRSFITSLSGTNVSNVPKLLEEAMCIDNLNRASPTGSWNVLMENEDHVMKFKLKNQLLSIRQTVDCFLKAYFKSQDNLNQRAKPMLSKSQRSITFDIHKGERQHKRTRMNNKKKMRHFDFPDIRDAMLNLFSTDSNQNTSLDESDSPKCICCCHMESPSSDSGVTSKSQERSMSITSSIGNFSLDSSTLTAYSESLDQIISYNSFEDSTLFTTMLQKAAIERITFYVQVHSIQIKCEPSDDFESKNIIQFHCPACNTIDNEENGLLRHILSDSHCEKIHFLYKTAYIKKCVQSGKEIQPSTVLNPMRMYRDENKIVCFGDAVYACSLCFENLIVGESVLMAHCSDSEHMERKEKLTELLE